MVPPDARTGRPLFRRQAIDHAVGRQYGTVLLTRPLSHGLLTAVFVGLALAIIAFLALFSITRKAQSQGVLLPRSGVVRIVPSQAGVITARQVQEGLRVHEGDVLFVLSSERNSPAVGATQQAISTLLAGRVESFRDELRQSGIQAQQRVAALARKMSDLGAEARTLEEQIVLQKQRAALAEQAFGRYRELEATRFISPMQLQDKQAEYLDQRQRLADLQRSRATVQRDLSQAQADLQDAGIQAQREQAALQRNASSAQRELTDSEARREIVVRAPQDGVVSAITGELGQTVSPNQPLAVMLPAGAELEAELYVPSRSAGFVRPGMAVMLRYPAYPYQKFGQHTARVREVASAALRPEDLPLPGTALSPGSPAEPLYRVRLRLDSQAVRAYGQDMPLKSGMRVEASILLEQRRLYEWVLEPLFSITGRL